MRQIVKSFGAVAVIVMISAMLPPSADAQCAECEINQETACYDCFAAYLGFWGCEDSTCTTCEHENSPDGSPNCSQPAPGPVTINLDGRAIDLREAGTREEVAIPAWPAPRSLLRNEGVGDEGIVRASCTGAIMLRTYTLRGVKAIRTSLVRLTITTPVQVVSDSA